MSVPSDKPFKFPALPILSSVPPPPPAPRSQGEKYGALFYLGLGGLAVLVLLVGFFVHGVWSHRDLWADVYTLHDVGRPATDRIQAAFRLSHDGRLSDSQRQEMALERALPELARYLLAEGVSTEVVARDPRAFALAVAKSADWPDWLRLLWARRLVYGSARQYAIPRDAVLELARHDDPMIRAWALAAFAASPNAGQKSSAELDQAAQAPGDAGQLAAMLAAALKAPEATREERLDDATNWMRRHHPQAAKIWEGWEINQGTLVRH
jgi:hypothetical protein